MVGGAVRLRPQPPGEKPYSKTKQDTDMENKEKMTTREKVLAAGFIALILFAEPAVDAFFSAFGL